MRRGGRIRAIVSVTALMAVIVPAGPTLAESFPLPRGYTIVGVDHLADGLTHVRYVALNPRRNLNVAYIKRNAPLRMKVVVSNDRIAGGTETVRSMCARSSCVMGVNGDLFSFGSGQPAGGIVSGGAPLRSPPGSRQHLTQDASGATAIQTVSTTTRFFATYPDHVEPFYIHGINTGRAPGQAILYTDAWAPTTQTGSGFEITLAPTDPGTAPRLGEPFRATMTRGFASGSASILPGTMVISAQGWYADLLAKLWSDVLAGKASPEATFTFASSPAVSTITGGTPLLLRAGRQAFTDRLSSFYSAQARTLAGRAANGDTIIAVIDGGRGSYWTGVRLLDAMRLMSTLGAVDALNMDGGGSSSFVTHGRTVNHPTYGERGVATALVLVPAPLPSPEPTPA